MTRRKQGKLQNERFCGDRKQMFVHDLDHEKPECPMDEIIAAGNEVPFEDMSDARAAGYLPCPHCFSFMD
ncbi:hypothetical protein ACFL45_02535 [Candidatus Neomarinimicrobiota bacterium]